MPTDQQIQERFDDLPKEVQEAIQSADMAAALRAVGTAHDLHLDQLGLLEDEALLVMLGFSNPAVFGDRIQKALQLDADTATVVAAEVSERLFVPIRSSMRMYMEERLKRAASGEVRATSNSPAQAANFQSTTTTAATAGGKTITPSAMQPVLHPADQALTHSTIAMPGITDFNAPRKVDPYREPVE